VKVTGSQSAKDIEDVSGRREFAPPLSVHRPVEFTLTLTRFRSNLYHDTFIIKFWIRFCCNLRPVLYRPWKLINALVEKSA